MIRFKVVRASRVLLVLALIALLAVAGFILARYVTARQDAAQGANASLVQVNEAKTLSVFASALLAPEEEPDGIEVEVLRPTATPAPAPKRRAVLIYHTHTHEAYEQVSDDPYDALEAWRTSDEGHSVVRVGRELANDLEALGFDVTHDVTDHEGDALSTAYERSLKTLESYDHPFDLYIDLHRDAWSRGMAMRYLTEDGAAFAQPMLLIGNGEGFTEKPDYEANLAFAERLTDKINAIQPGLCKDVLTKDGRYNQHIGTPAVLIEVGHNKNTLAEALATVPVLARAIADMYE